MLRITQYKNEFTTNPGKQRQTHTRKTRNTWREEAVAATATTATTATTEKCIGKSCASVFVDVCVSTECTVERRTNFCNWIVVSFVPPPKKKTFFRLYTQSERKGLSVCCSSGEHAACLETQMYFSRLREETKNRKRGKGDSFGFVW